MVYYILVFTERHDSVESQDMISNLTRYMMILSNNYYKEVSFSGIDII